MPSHQLYEHQADGSARRGLHIEELRPKALTNPCKFNFTWKALDAPIDPSVNNPMPNLSFLSFVLILSLQASGASVEIVPASLTGALQPQAAVGAKGEIHVVFGQKDGAFHHTISLDEARTFRAPVKIGALPKLALGMHRGPRVAVAGERVVVTAVSHESGDLLAWTSTDRGLTWSSPATLNTALKSAREGLHAMAAGGERMGVTWLDLRNGGAELWGALSKNGGASWEPDARIYQSPDGSICQCCAPSLAFGPRGELAAMWRNSLGGARDLYTVLSSDGATFGPAAKLGTGTWKLSACPMDGGGIAFLRTEPGKPVTVWRRDSTIYLARPGAPEESLGEGRDAAVAATARGPVIAWQGQAGLLVRRPGEAARILDAKGSAASAAAAPDGRFAVIVWESGSKETPVLKAEILR